MQNRIEFANQLRGIAAFSVVISHFFGVFWYNPLAVSTLLHTSLKHLTPPQFIQWINPIGFINYGAFGVALFFLISGFVIPFSLERYNTRQFFISRFLRIWPTYAAGLLISISTIILLNTFLKNHAVIPLSQIAANAFFLNGLLGITSIDGLNWTLQIEIKFYFLLGLMPFLLKKPQYLLYATLIFCLINLSKNYHGFFGVAIQDIKFNLVFINLMLVGCLFHLHQKEEINVIKLVVYMVLLLTIFSVQLRLDSGTKHMINILIPSYGLAFLTFLGCYMLSRYKKAFYKTELPGKFFNKLADISYPLYTVHAIFGYAYLSVFIKLYNHSGLALASCLFIVVIMASLLHKFIELPSNDYGKRLAKKFTSQAKAF